MNADERQCRCGHFADEHHDPEIASDLGVGICDACDCDCFDPVDDDDELVW